MFRIPTARASILEALLRDDVIGRQSVTSREARSLGLSGDGTIVLVEGSEDGVRRAEALLKEAASPLSGPEAEAAYRAFRRQDDEAASGMGLIFGG